MKSFSSLIILLFFLTLTSQAQVELPRLISDGAILQRDTDLKLWGQASPGELVTLTFNKNKYKAQADENGKWELTLPPQKAGGPFSMHFQAGNEVTVNNILFGDVWVCSGQSNMELTMERVKEKYQEVIQTSENPNIRQFLVPDAYDFKEEHTDFESGEWVAAGPQNVLDFSAVAYFFAKELYKENQIPIGLINTSLGGSPVEAWMSEKALSEFPEAYNEMVRFRSDSLIASIEESDKSRSDKWYGELQRKDQGLQDTPQWDQPAYDDSDWKTMKIPGYWADTSIGELNGSVWFRKEITVPAGMTGQKAHLWLGRIVDQDFAYVNGEQVGTTGYQYPPRRYDFEPGILKEGKNTIAIRVVNNTGHGGFVEDKPYFMAVGKDTLDLKGEWKYKVAATMPPLGSQTYIRWKPGGLYNKMIAPLLDFSIKGVIWYQGESNTADPKLYAETFPAMISDWRKNWGQGAFPFLYVQLTNFMETTTDPVESNWAELRQSQLETLKVPNTGMVVATDLGEWNDIHPLNKKDVGTRLASLAEKLAYGKENPAAASPVPDNAVFKKDKVVITFKNSAAGLIAKGDESLKHFSISNDGKNFFWARAKIKGDTVIVSHNKIKNPVAVRYGWANNPMSANLYTVDGLPASPFEVRK